MWRRSMANRIARPKCATLIAVDQRPHSRSLGYRCACERRKVMLIDALIINEKDNVATALRPLEPGTEAHLRIGEEIRIQSINEKIPYGHKFAVCKIEKYAVIIKYGEIIGEAFQEIRPGCHAHIQNIKSLRGRGDLR